ncbi:Myelin basic protein [Anabarilius grahami]|uniref:Myelin basic protein n=1 Tax=Anabarilius grahami TaxID=495550 RepID=A0A3N0YA13_ANAGA|nr:Myelin basic protein [Anabarilius grahami]
MSFSLQRIRRIQPGEVIPVTLFPLSFYNNFVMRQRSSVRNTGVQILLCCVVQSRLCLAFTGFKPDDLLRKRSSETCGSPGEGEADLNQNNGCSSKSPAVTDSMNAAVDHSSWKQPSSADPDASEPRPHLVRLFSRDAPGREDNTFKDRPSESDELQTIQEHGGSGGSECGSDCAEQDLE